MAKEVVVKVTAQDNASPVLKRIGSEAQAMGQQVEQSATRSGQSFDRFSAAGAALGAAVGAATLKLGEWTRAAAEDAANQARLQQSVENTGKSYDQFARQIDAAIKKGQELAFSDDDTRAALVNLNLVTNDTQASLNELGVVMDFARAKGIDLGTASEIVGKVMGGNLGILSRYGIQLDANATKEQALATIQQRSAGQATTYASTQAGEIDRMRDKWSELTEAVGAHASALTTVIAMLPGLTAGYTALSGVMAGLAGAGGFAALGPLAASLGLLAGGSAYAVNLNTSKGGWAENATIGALTNAAGALNFLSPGNPFSGVQQQFQDLGKSDNLTHVLDALFRQPMGAVATNDDYYIGLLINSGVLPVGFSGSLADAAQYIQSHAQASGVSGQQYIAAQVAQTGTYVYDPISGQYVSEGQMRALTVQRGRLLGGQGDVYGTGGAPLASTGVNTATPGQGYAYWLAHHTSTGQGLYGDLPPYQIKAAAAGGSAGVANSVIGQVAVAGTADIVDPAMKLKIMQNTANAAAAATAEAIAAATAAIKQYAPQLGLALPTAGVGGGITNASGVSARATNANTAAASGFQVAVGNTNAIGSQAQQTADWAKELINVENEQGKIDDLAARGVITQQEYNAAQAAGTSIFEANARIQDDILKIQTDQAPIIAQLTEEQARYMDHLAELTPQQQELRLAYMDTGEAAKAQAALTLAAAAANGELGSMGEETATKMISAAAEADPYLRSMLEDMGLITVGADGTITVNFDDVKNGNDAMGDLTDAINYFAAVIAQAFGIVVTMSDDNTAQRLAEIVAWLNSIHDVSFTVSASGNGIALGNPSGPTILPNMNGGTWAYANGGTAYDPLLPRFANGGGVYALVGEVGPELVKLNRGDQVMPAPGTRSHLERMQRGAGNNNFYGPVTLVPAGTDAYRAISQSALGEARY